MKRPRIVVLAMFAMVVFAGVGPAFADPIHSFTTIDVPGAIITEARGINGVGQIVGDYLYLHSSGEYGFLETAGSFTTVACPGASFTSFTAAFGINDSGQIVGVCGDSTGWHSFLDTGGSFTTIDVPRGAASLTFANGINASGQVVGEYSDSTDYSIHGFLATPTIVPEPRTLPALLGCLIGLAVALGRKSVRIRR
jgi:uncharacterized membrane protein